MPRPKRGRVQKSLWFDEEDWERATRLHNRIGGTRSAIIRQAMEIGLDAIEAFADLTDNVVTGSELSPSPSTEGKP